MQSEMTNIHAYACFNPHSSSIVGVSLEKDVVSYSVLYVHISNNFFFLQVKNKPQDEIASTGVHS